jgi:RimJ/RimL family protein N-acetyltransferase|uniref:GNAT family N-acetyltransferase n=1 Tax=Desulfobacca acetoxidans TaxID=60893 RepID=A0A7V6DQC9_9BACT
MEVLAQGSHNVRGVGISSGRRKLTGVRSDYRFYRKFVPLKNHKRVMLRFLTEEDRQDLIFLFRHASDEDLRFCRHDLREAHLLSRWLDHINSPRLLPLAAVDLDNNQLIAAGTVLRGKHAASHIGEIKLFIAQPFRNLALGSTLLDELMLLAARENLHCLKAEVVADQKQMIRALRHKGFQIRANLEDFFMSKDGTTYDLVLMMRALNQEAGEL